MITLNCVAALAIGVLAAQPAAQDGGLNSQKERVSYSIGVDMAKYVKQTGAEVDADALTKGLRDALTGQKLLLSDEDIQTFMTALRVELRIKQAQLRMAATEENKKAGETFLANNKTKKDVVTLPSGLQYKILKAGTGKKPTGSDTVECHYRGTLINGTEFDSSYRRSQSASFQVGGVIPGWQEALKLMPVGSKWQLVVPAELAYGAAGQGNDIPPNATLIFEVELLGIK